MKGNLYYLMLAIMSGIFFSRAQAQNFSGENRGVCGVDSCKTAKLNISTGIGTGPGSDSVLMKGGYGYNTYYSTPNDNRDTIWTVAPQRIPEIQISNTVFSPFV